MSLRSDFDSFHKTGGYGLYVGIIAALILIGVAALVYKSQPRSAETPSVVTDPETGCQYFESTLRVLTPRMDRDGHQICLEAPDVGI